MTPEEIAEKIVEELMGHTFHQSPPLPMKRLVLKHLRAYGLQQRREGYQEALDTLRTSGLNSVAESLIPPQGKP